MSGGSLDYLYQRVDDAGRILKTHRNEHFRAFGELLFKAAKALHDVEWAIDSDYSDDQAIPAIPEIVSPEFELACMIEEAKFATAALENAIERATHD